MKTFKYLYAALIVLLCASCDRSGVFEEFDKDIAWDFHLVVVSDENHTQPVSGASVELYQTSEDRDSGVNVYLSGQTDAKGEVVFSLKDFDKQNKGPEEVKGIYYIKVSKGDQVMTDLTRYLLMNSGSTYQWIVLSE